MKQQKPQQNSKVKKSWLEKYKDVFIENFNQDTTEEPIYLMTRDHFGSYVAMALSVYNVYLLRQSILKNSIHLTKSNNPNIVKAASFGVGAFYFLGLYTLWNIPCFFTEIAVRVYSASETAATNLLLERHIKDVIFSQKKLSKMLRKEGIDL